MRRFALVEPDTLQAAAAVLADDPEAKALGGGTALLILIKHGVFLPGTLVNLRKIDGSRTIELDADGWLRIGATASIADVERHALVRERYPMLASACHVVANVRIRNLATIGGNLAHADYQSDPPAALAALGAVVETVGPDGSSRRLPIREFLLGSYETMLDPAELVAAVLVPPVEPGWQGHYLKFTTRSSEDRPAAGVAVMIRREGAVIADARVVVGAVAPVPTEVDVAEIARGREPADDLWREIGALAAQAVEPIDDVRGSAAYKRRIAGVIVERALATAAGGAS